MWLVVLDDDDGMFWDRNMNRETTTKRMRVDVYACMSNELKYQ